MLHNITQYESLRNPELSYCGMVPAYALRNIVDMAENGLRAARKRIGATQPEIADRMGVSVPQVSRWETGRDNIPSFRLPTLVRAYEASLEELLGDSAGDMPEAISPDGVLNVEVAVSAETLEPILAQCLRLAPPGGWSELDAPLLARSVEYGLRFLATAPATQSIEDSLAVAGHAATLRLRELRHEA